MKIEATMTLAAVVDAHPCLAREFERRGLDYCCGGGRTLAEACTLQGLDPDTTVEELALAAEGSVAGEWSAMTADALADHLEATHHRYLWDEMPRVSALLDKIVSVHGQRHPELTDIATCFAEVRADLEPHMVKEERVLFPMIRTLAAATSTSNGSASPPSFHCGTLRNPIAVMLSEHDAVGDLLARLRQLTNGYATPDDGCATYRACFTALEELEADTHLHIHKENNVLFPMVVQAEAALAAGQR